MVVSIDISCEVGHTIISNVMPRISPRGVKLENIGIRSRGLRPGENMEQTVMKLLKGALALIFFFCGGPLYLDSTKGK